MNLGSVWKDSYGKEFYVKLVDHNMNGSWVHYTDESGKQYNCTVEAFKERFRKVENTR